MAYKNYQYGEEYILIANAKEIIDFKYNVNTDDYAPFRNLQIFNTGEVAIKVYLNNQSGFKYVPAGVILPLNDYGVNRIVIENTSATESANFVINADNDITELTCLKKIAGFTQ